MVVIGSLVYAGPSIFSVYQGGTGVSSMTAHGVVIGQGSSPVAVSSAGTTGQCFMSNGASADPTFQPCTASGGGANKIQFDQCTAGQTTNAGNSFWTVFAFTNWDAGHWEFVLNTNADLWCSVRVPSNQTGTMQIIIDLSSADTTSGHTATFNTADACTSSLNPQVGALTAAATQNYSSTTTAYSNTELTFNVQSTCAIDQILVVQIHQASGGANTSNIFMQPPKLKVM